MIQKIHISGGMRGDISENTRNSLEPVRKEGYKRESTLTIQSKRDIHNGDALIIQIPEKRTATAFSGSSESYFTEVTLGADIEDFSETLYSLVENEIRDVQANPSEYEDAERYIEQLGMILEALGGDE